jgi:aspartyl-tRNA(Asn)/glutamyl-tRNA(Gln) amidotransferase subunit A
VLSNTLVKACLDRIDRLNHRVNAFITILHEKALKEAHAAETEIASGHWRGPLHGIPIAVKDNIDTAGIRTTAARALFVDRVPAVDADVMISLKAAGAIVIGKSNMHEFAVGTTSAISHFGAVRNPWNTDYIAGGSSGGNAAAVHPVRFLAFGSTCRSADQRPTAFRRKCDRSGPGLSEQN